MRHWVLLEYLRPQSPPQRHAHHRATPITTKATPTTHHKATPPSSKTLTVLWVPLSFKPLQKFSAGRCLGAVSARKVAATNVRTYLHPQPVSTSKVRCGMHAYNPGGGKWRQEDPGRWLASPTESVSSRFSVRPCLKTVRWKMIEEDTTC